MQYLVNHPVRIDSLGEGIVAEDEAMTEDRVCHAAHVIGSDEVATFQPGTGSSTFIEGDAGAGAGADADPVLQTRLFIAFRIPGGHDQGDDIAIDVLRYPESFHLMMT